MKKRNRSEKTSKTRLLGRMRKLHVEDLEGRRMLAGDVLADVIIGSGNLPRRNTEIDAAITLDEIEQEDVPRNDRITNDTIATAELIPLGFDAGEFAAIDIRGELIEPSAIGIGINKEFGQPGANPPIPPVDDGSIPTANVVSYNVGNPIAFNGTLGDSPLGFNAGVGALAGGDGDFYEFEDLELDQVITAHVSGGAESVLVLYNAFGEVIESSEASPIVDNYIQHEIQEPGTYYIALVPFDGDLGNFRLPRDPNNASTVQGGNQTDYLLTVSVDSVDVDYYAVDLNAGDIFGVGSIGSANVLSLRDADGDLILQSSQDDSDLYPLASPLPGGGSASLAYVINVPGRYYLAVNGHNFNKYKLEMRVFRPVAESLPDGEHQILFLDFDGADFNPQVTSGNVDRVELSPLSDFLSDFDLSNESDLINRIVREVKHHFEQLRTHNPNMELTILNSKDHADPFGAPNVSRVIVGGTQIELGLPGFIGIADSIDVGNFDMSETAVVMLDILSGSEIDPSSLNHYPIARGANRADLVARGIGLTISHEAAHIFGAFHTENNSEDVNIVDTGGRPPSVAYGIGEDLVWGTADDFEVRFVDDIYDLLEGYTGIENVPGMLANLLVAGQGVDGAENAATVSGTVYADTNGNGARDSSERGLGGVRAYVDSNGDGRFGISEPNAITNASGAFSIPEVFLTSDAEIRIVTAADQRQTAPPESAGISISSNEPIVFGVRTLSGIDGGIDFGDAPASYGAASHQIQTGIHLGQFVDGEPATSVDDGADEDGVVFSGMFAGSTGKATVSATTSGFSPGVVSAWVDFNADGQFSAAERVFADVSVEGTSEITFGVPASASIGSTFARVRFGYLRGVAPTGAGGVGEVEDYVVQISSEGGETNEGPTANPDSFTVMQGVSGVSLNVLANDITGTAAVATIRSVGPTSQGGTVSIAGNGSVLVYSPAEGVEGIETFTYTIATAFGSSTATVSVEVEADSGGGTGDALVGFRLETVDLAGDVISSIDVGSDFKLNVYVDDLRAGGAGVFAAHLDVLFDQDLAAPNGLVEFGAVYTSGQVPTGGVIGEVDGEFDEYGGFAESVAGLDDSEKLLLSIPMTAVTDGILNLTSNFADILPRHEVLLVDIEQTIPEDRIEFGTTTLTIGSVAAASFTNPINRFDVNADGTVSARDALMLINSINRDGARFLTATSASISEGPFYDVNGDGALSARDVVQVVNQINRETAAAEPPNAAAMAAAVDSVFDTADDDEESPFSL